MSALRNRRILVVEDEYYLAMDLEQELIAAGADVVGPVPSVERALALINGHQTPDAAVLDINLGGEMSFPVANALIARSIPFVFMTGYVDGDIDKRYPHITQCEKPIDATKLFQALRVALEG